MDFATPNQKAQYARMNNFINEKISTLQDDNDDPDCDFDNDPSIDCQYYNFDEFIKAKFQPKKSFSILHLNIHSIQKHIDELRIALQMLKFKFDVIAISESLLIKGKLPIVDISLQGYHQPVGTPTESTKGGVLLYVSDSLNFIERPKLRLNNEKNIFIAGDFNFDLIKTYTHQPTCDFYDLLSTNFLLPMILLPTKINSNVNTLIDNIFTNYLHPNTVSGNLTVAISDHLPSFAIFPISNSVHFPKKHNIFKRDFSKLKTTEEINHFKNDFATIDWEEVLQLSRKDVNYSFDHFYSTTTELLDRYAPLKRMKNRDLKGKFKPWFNNDIKQLARQRDIAYGKYIRCKDPANKISLQDRFKLLRNQTTNKLRQSKYRYYKDYFIKNTGNIRNIWKGINQIVNVKSKLYDHPTHMEDSQGNPVDDPVDISNLFNNYYCNIAQTILDKRRFTGDGNFKKFLTNQSQFSLILSKVLPSEIAQIIKNLDPSKASGPISIPINILSHLCEHISPII